MSEHRLLHVANGTCTTNLIKAAGIPGLRSIWADPLYEGPVPSGLNDGELLEVRSRFLANARAPYDPVNDLREWRRVMARHQAYDELILWFEHDLFDQLNLIQLLSWIREHLPESTPVSLISLGSYPGRPDFKGLGELAPEELATLLDTRQPVRRHQFELAARAWQAFRSTTPESLDALRRDETSALPYLAPAIERFLQEYPWTRTGLSRSEHRLLELAAGEGIPLSKAFPRMHDGERVYYITDGSLADMAKTLGRGPDPLLTLEMPVSEHGPLRGHVSLTAHGRAVLSGERDRITNGAIDKWLGGVHLHSGTRIWRWDDQHERVV